jgi:N-methylhydantoinase A/oxoprolinase/acetone carboxylase beta subunit
LGADIGNTFTDVVLVDEAGGVFRVGKVLTTSDAPDETHLRQWLLLSS